MSRGKKLLILAFIFIISLTLLSCNKNNIKNAESNIIEGRSEEYEEAQRKRRMELRKTFIDPREPEEKVRTDLNFSLSYEIIEGALKPMIETNLPNNTEGNFVLSSEDGNYKRSKIFTIQNGTAISDVFTDNNKPLKSGKYKLEVFLLPARYQSDDVINIVGYEYDNFSGDKIKNTDEGVTIIDEIEVIIN